MLIFTKKVSYISELGRKKNDVQKVILHYGDPFIFIEDKYEAKKEMTKVTSDALFDYWQVTVSVDFARIQYLFELLDEEGQGVFYGDKGCVEHTQENLDAEGNGFKLPYIHEIDGCQVPRLGFKYRLVSDFPRTLCQWKS